MPIRALATLLAPPVCAGCGGHAGAAEPLCGACRRELRWLTGTARVGGVELFAPLAYEGPARAMVRALKFQGATLAADVMAAQIAAGAPPGALDRGVLVPVPLHPRRRRRRGFNQAERLAAALARRVGLPVADCLRRDGAAQTQVGRDRGARLAGVHGAGALRAGVGAPGPAAVAGDVVPTRATPAARAGQLGQHGPRDPPGRRRAHAPGQAPPRQAPRAAQRGQAGAAPGGAVVARLAE